ncbi:MAG: hypothetical protein JSV11_07625 [Nitrospiraceae bacterium]|nr:MAG: hypothetical protein JSV11_07625 [Nitrospiraceae bacterium]
MTKKRGIRVDMVEPHSGFICFNRECKLRKKKSCKGFEACPGFKGK